MAAKLDSVLLGNFKLGGVVGKGAYGTVWSGTERRTGQPVAIKHIDRVFHNHSDALKVARELRLLRVLRHPNLIEVKSVLLPRRPSFFDDICVVFELFETDVAQMIASPTPYDETHRRWILFQVLRGLAHMHGAGVFHRDLKPANILVNANCTCKICDLGLARAKRPGKAMGDDLALWTDYIASRWYRAPELICCYDTSYTAAVDLWAVGCIAAELLQRKVLFPGKSANAQLRLITDLLGAPTQGDMAELRTEQTRRMLQEAEMQRKSGIEDWSDVFGGTSEGELELLKSQLVFSAKGRISAADAMGLPWFAPIRSKRAAQIASLSSPDLASDPSARFLFDDVVIGSTTADLRELIYEEILAYQEPETTLEHQKADWRREESREAAAALVAARREAGMAARRLLHPGSSAASEPEPEPEPEPRFEIQHESEAPAIGRAVVNDNKEEEEEEEDGGGVVVVGNKQRKKWGTSDVRNASHPPVILVPEESSSRNDHDGDGGVGAPLQQKQNVATMRGGVMRARRHSDECLVALAPPSKPTPSLRLSPPVTLAHARKQSRSPEWRSTDDGWTEQARGRSSSTTDDDGDSGRAFTSVTLSSEFGEDEVLIEV